MLRTERISRSTKKEKFLALLGYEVVYLTMNETTFNSLHATCLLDLWNFNFSILHVE